MGELKKEGIELSRRSFLTGAAVISAGAAMAGLAGCSSGNKAAGSDAGAEGKAKQETASITDRQLPWEVAPEPIPDSKIKETINCDILVCGAGISGLPGIAYAAEQGANVHVLEKAGTWGTKRLCTCGFNADCQLKYDLKTDRDEFITEVWKITNGAQGRMVSYGRWFDNSAPYVNWLEGVFNAKGYGLIPQAATGVKVTNDGVGEAGGASTFWKTYAAMIYFVDENGKTNVDGGDLDWTGVLAKYAEEKGATFHYNTPAVQLVADSNGRITSVIGETEDGDYVKINASKGVLLACGDMAGDRDMMGYYNPSLLKVHITNAEKKNTGDGQKMGMWIGADMDDFAAGDLFPFVAVAPESGDGDAARPKFEGACSYAAVSSLPVFMVDTTGRRLAAEDLPFQAYSIPKLTATSDGYAWSVWDGAWEKKFPEGFPRRDYLSNNSQKQMDLEVENGLTLKADTLDELVKKMGVDPEIFKANLARYHALCGQGKDADFYKSAAWLTTIDTPPFYAVKHSVCLTSTRGGLRNDERCRVIDKKGLPIPGLYTAGNTAGSFYGNVYPPNIMGSGIGHGQCFSWIAVKDMLGLEYL